MQGDVVWGKLLIDEVALVVTGEIEGRGSSFVLNGRQDGVLRALGQSGVVLGGRFIRGPGPSSHRSRQPLLLLLGEQTQIRTDVQPAKSCRYESGFTLNCMISSIFS